MRPAVLIAPLLAAAAPIAPAAAQTPPLPPAADPEEAEETAPELVVTGSRTLPGSVIGDIAPEQQLAPADIRSYGVASLQELLAELAPQTRSGRGGAAVVLLNGRRISGFAEIRDLPTEAIARVDILPEEVALKYGYRADQRVVNVVLRRRFRAVTAELDARVATEGGRTQPEAELDVLRIRGTGRASLHLEYSRADALTEAERGIAQGRADAAVGGNLARVDGAALAPGLGTSVAVPAVAATRAPLLSDFAPGTNPVDQGAYRTLLPRARTLAANAVYATSVFGNVSATLNASLQHDVSLATRGLPAATLLIPAASPFNPFGADVALRRALEDYGPLEQRARSTDAHLGLGLNGDAGRWRWTLTANVDHLRSTTRTATGVDLDAFQDLLDASSPSANPYGALPRASLDGTFATFRSTAAGLDALATGPLLRLPAGDVGASLRIGASTSDVASRSRRAGVASAGAIGRDIAAAQANVDLPIASRGAKVLSWLGNLTLNANLAADRLSDAGALWTVGYGANWAPLEGVRLLASVTDTDEAPTAAQLANPLLVTPGVRVFDYVAGTTATVTTTAGGNAALRAANRRAAKLGLDLRPWKARDVALSVNYVATRTDDPVSAFPAATAALERAFPTRFTRDAAGTLLRIDTRPVNFARTERSELRYGVNLSFPLKSRVQQQLEAFRAGAGPDPFAGLRAERPGRGSPGERRFGGPGRGNGGGRLQFALYHTWHLTDRVLVAEGGPLLDLLAGDAIASTGGQPRHELEGQAGYSNNGLGARISANFRSATQVAGGTPSAPQLLDFGALTTLNLRLFADLGQQRALVRDRPWLRGTRLVLAVENAFNTRQRVTDQSGAIPVGFQPGYLDPLGRTVRLSVRKLFF